MRTESYGGPTCRKIERAVNVLEVLRCVYKRMGNRESITDPWLQKPVASPSPAALLKYRDELEVYKQKEAGHPLAAKSVRQLLKFDAEIKEKAERIRRASAGRTAESMAKILRRLFDEATNKPGGLEKFERLAEKELERYAAQIKVFREVTQHKCDEEHGLAPSPSHS